MLLELATPTRMLVTAEVDEVVAPGVEGYFGVLPGHAAFLTTLAPGEVVYRSGQQEHHLAVAGGFAEVRPERVIILADIGERASDIDVGRAEEAMKRAAERMKQIRGEAGYDEVRLDYVRAVTRLAVARKERGGA